MPTQFWELLILKYINMKKIFLCAIALVCFNLVASAQFVKEEVVEFEKVQVSALTVMLPDMNMDIIANALQEHFEKTAGLKSSKTKGYTSYLAQAYPPYGTQNFDIFVKLEETGKKSAKTPKITLLVSKGNNNFISSSNDNETFGNIRRDLESFVVYVKEYEVNQRIIVKNNELQKLVKEKEELSKNQTKLQKSLEDLEKKLKENDKQLQENEKQIKKVESEIEKANGELKSFH